MADNQKLNLDSACEVCGLEENMGAQKISVSDHIHGFQHTTNESDSFVIDMESLSHGTNKDVAANSRNALQRSISRKGLQRGGEKKINYHTTDRDGGATSSPTATLAAGGSTPEKPALVAVGATDHCTNPQVHHQITITATNINGSSESRYAVRRNSFKRSPPPPPWLFDPKRILFIFATLSSMGTILLIYFTLSIGKLQADENVLN